jgi:hypothetical protein
MCWFTSWYIHAAQVRKRKSNRSWGRLGRRKPLGIRKKRNQKRCDELKTRILLMLKLQVALRRLRKGSSPLTFSPWRWTYVTGSGEPLSGDNIWTRLVAVYRSGWHSTDGSTWPYTGRRVSEELIAESIRDEIIWSPYAGLDKHLGYFISVA